MSRACRVFFSLLLATGAVACNSGSSSSAVLPAGGSTGSGGSGGGTGTSTGSGTGTGTRTGSGTGSGTGGGATGATGGFPVALTVTEDAGVPRGQAPLRSGVPFPKGLLAVNQPVSLHDGARSLPLQTRPLSIWDDGTVRWLLIDTQVDLSANQEKVLELRAGAGAAPLQPLSIIQQGSVIAVDTGPLKFEVPTGYGGLIHRAWVDNQLVVDAPVDPRDRGPWVRVAGTDYFGGLLQAGSTPRANDPILGYRQYVQSNGQQGGFNLNDPWNLSVTIEESGPLHGVIRISGAHLTPTGEGFSFFVTRIHAYQGQRNLALEHTFVFSGDGQDRVESYGVRLPFVGGETVVEGARVSAGSVAHLGYDGYSVTSQGARQGQALGTIGRSDGNVALGVALSGMAENFPKALVATSAGLEVQLYPEAAAPWDLSRYSNSVDTANGESGNDRNRGSQGLSKTETFSLLFSTGAVDVPALTAQARALGRGDLMAFAEPGWVSNARVMGVGAFAFDSSLTNEAHYRIDRALRVATDFMRFNQRVQFKWFGLVNYGDIRGRFNGGGSGFTWHELGRYGWSGNSGEPSNQLWVQFLRRPSRDVFLDAEALARHTMDTQMVHYGDAIGTGAAAWSGRNRESAVGSLHRHGRQAWSGYAGLPEYSHVAGVETYYYLTGSGRAKEALFEAAQFIERYGRNTPRYTALVNGLDCLSRAEAVFFDQPAHAARFRDRAEVLIAHLASGTPNALQRELAGANISSSFGVFIRGMPGILYHHERTGDPRLAQLVFDAADVLVAGPQGDAWGLGQSGEAGSVLYYLNTLTYASGMVRSSGSGPASYAALTQRVMEWNCHATSSPGTGAISLSSWAAIPQDWRDWSWSWEQDPLNSRSPGLLWIDRQLTFRNDYMQDYHSYRALLHLAVAAADVPLGAARAR